MGAAAGDAGPEVTEALVRHVAALARLRLDDEELPALVDQFRRMLEFVAVVQETDGAPSPLGDSGALEPASMRTDSARESGEAGGPVGHEAIAKNAPRWSGDAFETPKVVG